MNVYYFQDGIRGRSHRHEPMKTRALEPIEMEPLKPFDDCIEIGLLLTASSAIMVSAGMLVWLGYLLGRVQG